MHNMLALTLDPGAHSLSPVAPLPALPPSSVALTSFNVGADASSMTTPVNTAPVAMPTVTMPAMSLPPVVNSVMFNPMPLAHQQSTPNPPLAIPFGSLVKPFPILSYNNLMGATFFDARVDLATKIKGGMALATSRNSYKFTPYWQSILCDASNDLQEPSGLQVWQCV